MFLCGYLGSEAGLASWCYASRQHALWLGLDTHFESRVLPDGRTLCFVWLARDPAGTVRHLTETDQQVIATTGASPAVGTEQSEKVASGGADSVSVTVSLPDGELTIAVPMASPQRFHYVRTRHGYLFGDDLRLFLRVVDVEFDEAGIYALFQYGAVPAPLTIWRGVRSCPSGHRTTLRTSSTDPVCVPFLPATHLTSRNGEALDPEARIREALVTVLGEAPRNAVLYFSGGVDSGLLAALLARAGRRDVRLVNYAFGADDPESLLARRMAAHLGLTFEEVRHDPARIEEVLARLGRDYSYPFEDLSTIPTNLLVHASLGSAAASHTVIEGTGADGGFGLTNTYPRWRRTYAVPALIRRQAGRGYAALHLWERRSRLERLGAFVRKSARMPLGYAVVAQNALDGIAYAVSPEVRTSVLRTVRTHIEALSGGAQTLDQVSVMDLIWVCAGRMAAKSFDPLRTKGIRTIYPFLRPSVLGVSISLSSKEKSPQGEAKGILKHLLAQDVPREWVYRSKNGFTPPYQRIFADNPMQDYVRDVVLSSHNPFLKFCRADTVADLMDRARKQALSSGAYEFLWALTFASAWLQQQPSTDSCSAGRVERESLL